jgi:hypothetical protein
MKITQRTELKAIQELREYYKANFKNGESDEQFLNWIENNLNQKQEPEKEVKLIDKLIEGKKYKHISLQGNLPVYNAIFEGKMIFPDGITLFFKTSETNHFQKYINNENQILIVD